MDNAGKIMKETEQKIASPKWSTTTKAIVTLLILAAVVALIIRFSSLMSTLVTAIVIAILFHPLAEWLNKKLKISWTWAVTIIYLITLVIVFGLITLSGIAIINQIQSFINFLQDSLGAISAFFERLTTTVISVGPFTLDFTYINWTDISNQLLSTLEPLLSNIGNFLGSVYWFFVFSFGDFISTNERKRWHSQENLFHKITKLSAGLFHPFRENQCHLECLYPRAIDRLPAAVYNVFDHPQHLTGTFYFWHGFDCDYREFHSLYRRGNFLDNHLPGCVVARQHCFRT
jgi:hypothetical protein